MRQATLVAPLLLGLTLTACATGMKFVPEGGPFERRGTPEQIQVFQSGPTDRPYDRVGRITWDYTHKKFELPKLEEALPALKQKAWESGGDALVVLQANFIGQPAPDKPLHIVADVIRWRS